MGKYNLIIITPDQMRADYLGCYGHKSIGTRHIVLWLKMVSDLKICTARRLCADQADAALLQVHIFRNITTGITGRQSHHPCRTLSRR